MEQRRSPQAAGGGTCASGGLTVGELVTGLRPGEWLTVTQVAQHFVIGARHIRRLIALGRIPAKKVGNKNWRISARWVHAQHGGLGPLPPPAPAGVAAPSRVVNLTEAALRRLVRQEAETATLRALATTFGALAEGSALLRAEEAAAAGAPAGEPRVELPAG